MGRHSEILSLGTMYADFSCFGFPFIEGLSAHKETVGDKYELVPGGSALNFARICAKLGMQPTFIGKAGQDQMGKLLEELLEVSGITPAIIKSPDVATNVAVHYVNEDGHSIMTSVGSANQSITADEVMPLFEEKVKKVHFLYLGGAFKMKSLLPCYMEMITIAHRHGVKVVLDHGRVNNSVTPLEVDIIRTLLQNVDIYLPSKDEFLNVWSADTIEEGLRRVRDCSSAVTIVKNSEDGATGAWKNKIARIPAYPVKVLNSVGAGDSFNAGFIAGMAQKRPVIESMRYACAVAASQISTLHGLSLHKVTELLATSEK